MPTIISSETKPTGISDLFRHNAESLLRDFLMQRVACREVADAELITYGQCLGALAFAAWSDEEKTGREIALPGRAA
jgi:hypothetical protein